MTSLGRPAQEPNVTIRIWHVGCMALATAMFLAIYCEIIGLNVMPFRGESGWFIASAWSHEDRFAFIRPMLIRAYNGHFAPLFFGLEFLQSGWFGAEVRWWFARQMLVLGLLTTSLYLLGRSGLAFTSLGRLSSATIALLAALLFVVQPTVLELATWPFMAGPLLCIACGAVATAMLLTAARTASANSVYWALAWGYASMHLFGVGLAISLTALVAAIVLIWARELPQKTYNAPAAFAVLTLGHAWIMARTGVEAAEHAVTWSDQWTRFGALYMGSIQAGMRSLWSNGRFPWPNPDSYQTDAAYGFGVFVTMLTVSAALLWRGKRDCKPSLIAGGLLIGMSTLALGAYCALIVFRLRHDPSLSAINPFLFGTRYIVFPAFFLFLLSPLILIAGARALGRRLVWPVAILTTAASVATYVFFTTIATLWPIFAAPFPMTWHQVVSDARIQLEAGGYIRDRKLSELDPEFHAELSQFRGLLDHELGCQQCARFSPAQAPSSAP